MKKKSLVLVIIVVTVMVLGLIRWKDTLQDSRFECRAKLHLGMAANTCRGSSIFDIFFSFHGDGEGYFIVSGTYTCPNLPAKPVKSTVNFHYKREGDYYALNLGSQPATLSTLFKVFNYKEVKVKITKMDTSEYIIYLPFETPMICKQD